MGYKFKKPSDLSYHHAFRFDRDGGKRNYENGVILVRETAHDYIHLIEAIDKDIFDYITFQFAIQKNEGYIDYECIKRINNVLNYFEKEYGHLRSNSGLYIIKEEYKKRILSRW